MRLGIDGRKIPESKKRGGVGSVEHAHAIGMDGIFFRTVLDFAPTLDPGVIAAVRQRADEFGMYLEMGLGKVNPYAIPETPELRAVGDGDTLLGFRRMMEACAAVDCRELWVGTANFKGAFHGRYAVDRFRTDVDWADQLLAIEKFLRKLKPIALDLGIHINLETHEEITSFEVVRLVEALGTEAFGIVYDTSNGLQRIEHPVWVARRVAPYVRQTHFKDLAMTFRDGWVETQARPPGKGVIDFGAILKILAAAKPDLNITIENFEPYADGPKPARVDRLDIVDPSWIAAHPDCGVAEYAAYIAMIHAFEAKVAAGDLPPISDAVSDFTVADAVRAIGDTASYLRGVCEEFALPLRKLAA